MRGTTHLPWGAPGMANTTYMPQRPPRTCHEGHSVPAMRTTKHLPRRPLRTCHEFHHAPCVGGRERTYTPCPWPVTRLDGCARPMTSQPRTASTSENESCINIFIFFIFYRFYLLLYINMYLKWFENQFFQNTNFKRHIYCHSSCLTFRFLIKFKKSKDFKIYTKTLTIHIVLSLNDRLHFEPTMAVNNRWADGRLLR